MLHVKLGGPLMSKAGGATEFDVEAATIREMLARLGEQYPQLKPILDRGVAVAGQRHDLSRRFPRSIPEGAEVFILPPLVGG